MTPTQPAPDTFAVRVQFGTAELVERVALRVYNGDREITREVFGAEFGEVVP